MSKKKTPSENPYKINTDAVDRLVNASNMEPPKSAPTDPGKKYKRGFLDKIPSWAKALFIKFWFSGAACYFIMWGLGMLIVDYLDMIVVMAISLGMITDLLVNNTFRFLAVTPGENDKWMIFPKKSFWTFPLNIIYSFVVLYIVIWIYNIINVLFNIGADESFIALGVEPIWFGIFYMAVDMAFVGMKNLIASIIRDAKAKNGIK
ncbi:MAG: hypothetical protein IKC32_05960 [Clostridia bacterium]|nr:hypothetical protein [Clostridia bacterium]